MQPTSPHLARQADDGFALIAAMVFLVLLTLVGLVALRGSGLEALVSGNNAQRSEAFESSEAARATISDIIDAHVYNHGWPAAAVNTSGATATTGTVPDSEFGTLPTGFTLQSFDNWYSSNAEDSTTTGFDPNNLTKDAQYSVSVGTTNAPATVYANLYVYKLRTDYIAGAGLAGGAGSEGLGRSASAGGGNLFFYVKSSGKDLNSSTTTSTTNYDTSADYRYVIRP